MISISGEFEGHSEGFNCSLVVDIGVCSSMGRFSTVLCGDSVPNVVEESSVVVITVGISVSAVPSSAKACDLFLPCTIAGLSSEPVQSCMASWMTSETVFCFQTIFEDEMIFEKKQFRII